MFDSSSWKRGAETVVSAPPVGSASTWRPGGLGGGTEHFLTLGPVAGAELVGLQRVEDSKRLLRVAADIEAVDRDVLDDVVGIDDEGGAIGDALIRSDDAERVRQLLLVVGNPGE